MIPVAWMRQIRSPSTPDSPGEIDYDFCYGDDEPEGGGWVPLYREPQLPPAPERARPKSEWHEDIGPVLWWKFPIDEPPYVGTPLDLGYTVAIEANGSATGSIMVGGWPGYHTHWTPIPLPSPPTSQAAAVAGEDQKG